MVPLMVSTALLLLLALSSAPTDQQVEKQMVASIAGPDLRGGLISEITWDGGLLLLQGVFAQPTGELTAHYLVVPADGITLEKRAVQSDASRQYWEMKSNRVSPTGLGKIVSATDTKMPQFGIGSLERRIDDAVNMGGTQTKSQLLLGSLTLLERDGPEPYDGETWSWSPAELNRIAYVDGKGDLWVAHADGRSARRLMKGKFSLPAWSDDGRTIAVAERKEGGRRWEISVIHLPPELRGSR
jgi:hypothetical protein